MFRYFLPKEPAFFEQFKQLNACIKEITDLSYEFVGCFKDFKTFFIRAKDIEHKADSITHEIINNLNKTFITPFDREDIYALAQEMDDLVDLFEEIIQTIYIYQINEKKIGLEGFVDLMVKASIELDKLIIECFEKQKCTPCTKSHIVKIHELEDEGDLLYQKVIGQLFAEEKDPIMVVKWKDVYDDLEEIMDKFQKVSDTIESVIVKSS